MMSEEETMEKKGISPNTLVEKELNLFIEHSVEEEKKKLPKEKNG